MLRVMIRLGFRVRVRVGFALWVVGLGLTHYG